ncbi:MAG: DUF6049 family protein, partial [Nocardioidaceae bacterium]
RWLAATAGVAVMLGTLTSAATIALGPGAEATTVGSGVESPSRSQIGRTPVASAGSVPRHGTQLERTTGLAVSLDKIKPASLAPHKDLVLKGVVTNTGAKAWRDAQVYLDIESQPATTRAALDSFRTDTEDFGTRVINFGRFDEIGRLKPGTSTRYTLSIPYGKLPISRDPGVYHVGATVIAGDRDGTRAPVARVDTVIPLLPDASTGPLTPTGVVTLIPLSAPIHRQADGTFLDDSLAQLIAIGGQLRNLLDFVAAAPPNTLEVVLDPALRQAIADMAGGYRVRSLAQVSAGEVGVTGAGQADAKRWLTELDSALRTQDLLFMPWGSPDASALGAHALPGVVDAAVRASQRYAAQQRITATVASWPYAGASTRRGLAIASRAGMPLRFISQRSLTTLRGEPRPSYPPTQVLVPTAVGQVTALVTRTDIAGTRIGPELGGPQLLRDIVAEATVRSLDKETAAISVVAVPFGWDPGVATTSSELAKAYGFPTVVPETASSAAQQSAVPYTGSVAMPTAISPLPTELLSAIKQLRDKGRIFTDLVSDQNSAVPRFDQILAASGTSLWRDDLPARVAVTERATQESVKSADKVTVTGPTFVALSSASGRFPLTVTNGLSVPVTVEVVVRAENPAVTVDAIAPLTLEPGQRRDIEATARSDGSGLTGVKVRLTTTTHRPVGQPWTFDVRSTQIGVAIWVVMGVGAAILFGAAGRRIVQRVRGGRLTPRGDAGP